jgi:hypothetical protein
LPKKIFDIQDICAAFEIRKVGNPTLIKARENHGYNENGIYD